MGLREWGVLLSPALSEPGTYDLRESSLIISFCVYLSREVSAAVDSAKASRSHVFKVRDVFLEFKVYLNRF